MKNLLYKKKHGEKNHVGNIFKLKTSQAWKKHREENLGYWVGDKSYKSKKEKSILLG